MSNLKSLAIISLLVFSIFETYSQSSFSEEKDKGPSSPIFKGGTPGMMSYFNKEIVPIISRQTKNTANLPASLKIILTIDKKGEVIDVLFITTRIEENCKSAITNKLLKMKGWKPAKFNGEAIVAKYNWNISCLLWQ
jgi:hypothetical protein